MKQESPAFRHGECQLTYNAARAGDLRGDYYDAYRERATDGGTFFR